MKIKPIGNYKFSLSISQINLVATKKKNGFEMKFGGKYVIKRVDTQP